MRSLGDLPLAAMENPGVGQSRGHPPCCCSGLLNCFRLREEGAFWGVEGARAGSTACCCCRVFLMLAKHWSRCVSASSAHTGACWYEDLYASCTMAMSTLRWRGRHDPRGVSCYVLFKPMQLGFGPGVYPVALCCICVTSVQRRVLSDCTHVLVTIHCTT